MKLLYSLPLFFLELSNANSLSQSTLDLIEQVVPTDGCEVQQTECEANLVNNYSPVDITFVEAVEETINGVDSCCYYYTSTHTSRQDCAGKNPALSHFNLGYQCDDEDIVANMEITEHDGSASIGNDGSTCIWSLKFDSGCESSCSYHVCINWPTCETATGWGIVKAGNQFSWIETTVPKCPDRPGCDAEGLALSEPHECVCLDADECSGDYCNTMEFVKERISDTSSSDSLCDEGQVCCCSCPNCDNWLRVA